MNRPYKPEEFWTLCRKTDSCWVWVGSLDGEGYGRIMFEGKRWKAHRLAWTLTNGPIAPEMKILHRCDNPPCINPDHCFLGTQADNVRDMESKGRGHRTGAHGERNSQAVLAAEQVREIRNLTGISGRQIAFRYGVSPMTISRILNRQLWKEIQ